MNAPLFYKGTFRVELGRVLRKLRTWIIVFLLIAVCWPITGNE